MQKKTVSLFVVFAMTLSMMGCAKASLEGQNSVENHVESGETASFKDKEPVPFEKKETEVTPAIEVEVSDRSATVYYAGEQFAKSIFAAGGGMLYIYGIKADGDYFLGCMESEEDVFKEFTVEMDEDMRAFNMAVDEQGRCHILWMSIEKCEIDGQSFDMITYEKSYITIVGQKGLVEKEIDVSAIFSPEQKRPICFSVDREGNYFFEKEKELIQIRNDGTQGMVAKCDGWIEGIGVGRSGRIYCTYENESGDSSLAKLEGDTLRPCDVQLPQSVVIYDGIYAGTDSELLLINIEDGVFACDENDIETRIPATELPVRGAEIAGYDIFSDGRACMMEQKNGSTTFYYIPAGK